MVESLPFISRYGEPSLPALVLLHGFMGNKHDWQGLMPTLSQHFYCICIDLPGHGNNRFALDSESKAGLEQCAAHLLSELAAINILKFHLLGYSLGGRVALHMAKSEPHRLLSLTLESAHPGLVDENEKTQRFSADSQWAKKLTSMPFSDFLTLWYQQGVFADLNASQRQDLIATKVKQLAVLGGSVHLSHKLSCLKAAYLATSLGRQQDCRQVIDLLTCSCQMIVGEQDAKFLGLAKAWQQQAVLAVKVINNAGHNVHQAQPKAFCEALLSMIKAKEAQL